MIMNDHGNILLCRYWSRRYIRCIVLRKLRYYKLHSKEDAVSLLAMQSLQELLCNPSVNNRPSRMASGTHLSDGTNACSDFNLDPLLQRGPTRSCVTPGETPERILRRFWLGMLHLAGPELKAH
jgi:hypothetical protein